MPFVSIRLLLTAIIVCVLGCRESEHETKTVADRPIPVNGVHLSTEAKAAIGLVTESVRRRTVRQSLPATGWLEVKPGLEVIVKATTTGFLLPTNGESSVDLGATVSESQTLGSLRIFLTPPEEAQLVALKEQVDIAIRQSLATLRMAQERYENVRKLDRGAVAGKDVNTAWEILERSRAAYEEARDQLPFLPLEPYDRPLQLAPLEIESPMAGRITEVHARPRQLISPGDPLWTVSDWSSLWLRVPVFEGDLQRIDSESSAEITGAGIESLIRARPTGLPQPTREGRRTLDVLYEVDNRTGQLRPGQAVSVSIPTGHASERLVVPQSAIVWDGMGNAWLYTEASDLSYHRQRVRLGPTIDDDVVVEHGLDEGSRVVTVGAESLFGEEFKGQIPVEDEDD